MAKQLRQARAVVRAASNWVRNDLREILFPSSIPTPPGVVEEHEQRSRRDWPKECARVCRRYMETWDSAKMRAERAAKDQESGVEMERHEKEEGHMLSEEFGRVARGGTKAVKPFLANLYQSRARAYRDAAQQFVQGYKQGFEQAMQPEVPPEVAQEMAAAAAAKEATVNAAAVPGAPAAVPGTPALMPAADPTSGLQATATRPAATEGDLHAAAHAAAAGQPMGTVAPPAVRQRHQFDARGAASNGQLSNTSASPSSAALIEEHPEAQQAQQDSACSPVEVREPAGWQEARGLQRTAAGSAAAQHPASLPDGAISTASSERHSSAGVDLDALLQNETSAAVATAVQATARARVSATALSASAGHPHPAAPGAHEAVALKAATKSSSTKSSSSSGGGSDGGDGGGTLGLVLPRSVGAAVASVAALNNTVPEHQPAAAVAATEQQQPAPTRRRGRPAGSGKRTK